MQRANRGNLVKINHRPGVEIGYYGIIMSCKGKTAVVFLGNGVEIEAPIDALEILNVGFGQAAPSDARPANFMTIMNPRL